ncbi:unnamed protein product [Ilex paraguariensis]|uniref:Uncharacterized protein n=1 Tax=Ilex paraguariensis TaxID=185542 RepID=A0ABC8UA41_9AQUA
MERIVQIQHTVAKKVHVYGFQSTLTKIQCKFFSGSDLYVGHKFCTSHYHLAAVRLSRQLVSKRCAEQIICKTTTKIKTKHSDIAQENDQSTYGHTSAHERLESSSTTWSPYVYTPTYSRHF